MIHTEIHNDEIIMNFYKGLCTSRVNPLLFLRAKNWRQLLQPNDIISSK